MIATFYLSSWSQYTPLKSQRINKYSTYDVIKLCYYSMFLSHCCKCDNGGWCVQLCCSKETNEWIQARGCCKNRPLVSKSLKGASVPITSSNFAVQNFSSTRLSSKFSSKFIIKSSKIPSHLKRVARCTPCKYFKSVDSVANGPGFLAPSCNIWRRERHVRNFFPSASLASALGSC